MQTRILNSRLAGLYAVRQLELLSHADTLGESIDAAVLKWWNGLWAHNRRPSPLYFAQLEPMILEAMRDGFRKLAYWSHDYTSGALAATLPLPWLGYLASRRRRTPWLTEDDYAGPYGDGPGSIELWLDHLGLNWRDMMFPLGSGQDITAEKARKMFQAILFPPPTEGIVNRYIDDMLSRSGYGRDYRNTNAIANTFSVGFSQGKGIKELAKDIEPLVGGVQSAARRNARTMGMHVAHAVQDRSHAAVDDLTVGWQIRNPLDQNTRPEHRLRAGTIYYKEPKPGQPGLDEMPRPPLEADGSVAFNCMPGYVKVQGRFNGALKSWYSGQIIEIETRSGLNLTLTPNHPVCTSAGFVPCGMIAEGDCLLRYGEHVETLRDARNEENEPARIDDVFAAAQQLWPSAIKPASRFDFHGDGALCNGNVEIVSCNGMLANGIKSNVGQPSRKFGFVSANEPHLTTPSFGALHLDFNGIHLPTSSSVRGVDLLPPRSGIHSEPFDTLSVGLAANLDASRYELANQSECTSVRVKPSPSDSEFISQLFKRGPGLITLDYVSKICKYNFSGHVYDLQSPYGFIVASNIVISNCRCFLTVVMSEPDYLTPRQKDILSSTASTVVPDVSVYQDYWQRATEKQRRFAVGSKRYSEMSDLIGREPDYAHFVNVRGRLLSVDELQSEDAKDRNERVNRVKALMDKRRADVAKLATYGWV